MLLEEELEEGEEKDGERKGKKRMDEHKQCTVCREEK